MRVLHGLLIVLTAHAAWAADPAEFSREQLEFFERDVRPLLVERCHKCHGAEQQKGNLRLDSRTAVLQGGDTGPSIVAGAPDASELIQAVRYDPDGYQMPPDGKLPDEEIAILTRWVAAGAPWPTETADSATDGGKDWDAQFSERLKHWSFQPLVRHAPPLVEGGEWCRNPIDRFVAAKRQAAGLTHADEADRRTWLRRAYFDVIGLPPSPGEVEAFVSDAAPGAHERVIDRLLTSPHLGERWGRHWLDLVRYAESRGHEFDYDVANPWPYRDYVVRAINADVPYDRFVVEHVSGDLLKVESRESRDESDRDSGPEALDSGHSTLDLLRRDPATGANESIVGTGFWFLGEWVHSPVDIRQEEADRFANMIDVYSKTFLGLTVACARCHDHKFDPIPQSDFYALQGYLQSSSYRQAQFEHWIDNLDIAQQLTELEDEATLKLLPLFDEITRPQVECIDDYLLAALEVVRANGKSGAPLRALTSEHEPRIAELAADRGLESEMVRVWTAHLLAAAQDPRDPFHLWGQLASGELSDVSALRDQLNAERPDQSAFFDWLDDASSDGRVLWSTDFVSDGIAFPERAGNAIAILGSNPEQPLQRIEEFDYREFDPVRGDLPLAAHAMRDAAKLGALERDGRSLRTPTFEISTDKIACEIRGGCQTYLVVDSHAVINGPLHGSLLQDHPTPQDQSHSWRWIQLDSGRYRGHRAHLEFVPRRGEPFAVRQAVLADALPAGAGDSNSSDAALEGCSVDATLEELATEHQQIWTRIACCVPWFLPTGGGRSGGCSLHTAEWARAHSQLFGLDTDEARRKLAAVAQPLIERRNQLQAQLRSGSHLAPAMLDGSGEDEYLFIRGNWKKRGESVPRRFMSAFGGVQGPVSSVQSNDSGSNPAPIGEVHSIADVGATSLNSQPSILNSPHSTLDTQLSTPTASGRLELALQMVDPQQTPIVARVIVNRIWQHYFGRGIVPTPDDLGHLGLAPSHPELLDWLATELIAHDWSLKHIHRRILESSTYRMASEGVQSPESSVRNSRLASDSNPAADTEPSTLNTHLDPGNALLWHMPVKRLEGEIIRDAILSISGRLDDTMTGRSVPIHLTSFLEGRGRPGESGPVDGRGRRSLYLAVRRNFPEPFFQAFDFPNPHSTIGRRNVSNVPAQALAMMNNPMVIEQCGVAAHRLLRETPGQSTANRVERLYLIVFARSPNATERQAGLEFIASLAAERGAGTDDAGLWSDYLHVLLNAKEFLFVR